MAGFQSCGLSIFQSNCNGLLAHLNEFKQHLVLNSYDVICLQETFLKLEKKFTLPGFTIIRKDRTAMGKGGLVTLIRDSIDYTEITPQDGIECISIKIKSNLYIPPDQDIDINLISSLFTPKTVIVV